ncbi:MAG: TetR/AcrR family transcriptional regulator [Deferribacteres bacterium]|nr:TetR/AcrR family transcriptional regulator [Deferribacteres bacterium]
MASKTTSRLRKKERKSKREKILKAAERVFAEKGFHTARIADIAKLAGIAEGTIYIYFDSKEDLILSIFKERFGDWLEKLKQRLKECSTAKEKLAELIKLHFKSLEEDPHFAQLLQIELRACSAFMRGGSAPELKAYLKVMEEVIEEGKEKGEFRENLNSRIAARALLGMMDEMVTIWVLKKRFKLPEVADEIFGLFYQGIKGGV